MYKILVKGLEIHAFHGVNPEEKRDGQKFILDIECDADLQPGALADSVENTASYAKILKRASAAFTREKYDLIETAGYETAKEILDSFPCVARVRVLVKKPEAPIKAEFEYVGVEVGLDRGEKL